jgi:fumarate reductase flavoprotein subunit
VGRACIAYPDWAARIAGENLELFIDSTQREALNIPEPLWRFSLVEAMIRDMSMGDAKFKPGLFVETVQDDANELVINVSLENDRIADIELAAGPAERGVHHQFRRDPRTHSDRQYAARGRDFRRDQPE